MKNPPHDAAIIADSLNANGFDVVTVRTDLSYVQFGRQLLEFAAKAKDAEIAIIYYAGHGILSGGVNYMIPVDAVLKEEDRLAEEAINLDRIAYAIHDAKVRIVIFDACRNNPFQRSWTSATRATLVPGLGPAPIDGDIVIFSAAPGQEANDGNGQNSPFAQALARRLIQPDLQVQLLGNAVRDDVMNATGNRQRPFVSSSISVTPAYLNAKGYASMVAAEGGGAGDEALSWQGAMRADTLDGYQSYIEAYPKGKFTRLAAANLKRLNTVRLAGLASAAPRTFADDPDATAKLNQFAKQQFDKRDAEQEAAMAAWRRNMDELAQHTATLSDEYVKKQDAFRLQEQQWEARVAACNGNANAKRCIAATKANAPIASPNGLSREALAICRPPGDQRERRSDCQGPAGKGSAILGTEGGNKLLTKLCDEGPGFRDLGISGDGLRVYGCGFGPNPLRAAKKANADLAVTFGLPAITSRKIYRCTDKSEKVCRMLAAAQ